MIKKKDFNKKFFYVQCGDWEATTVASTHMEACLNVMSQAIDTFGKEISLTDVMISSDCDNTINEAEDSIEGFLVERILKELSYEY